MTENDPSSEDSKNYEHKLKLYAVLVEQFFKHQSTIWQIPAALVFGNFVVIEKFPTNPIVLFALAVFNSALIFILSRMIKGQQVIIDTIINAENSLKTFSDFLPKFEKHRFKARELFMVTLIFLEICLFAYIGSLVLCDHHCH